MYMIDNNSVCSLQHLTSSMLYTQVAVGCNLFCAVVIWCDMLGDLQYFQDTLPWHSPNSFDCSTGEWREAPKAK